MQLNGLPQYRNCYEITKKEMMDITRMEGQCLKAVTKAECKQVIRESKKCTQQFSAYKPL